jgi:hypothetical protein
MERETILDCLRTFGMANIRIAFEDRLHEIGPSFNLVASRG